MAGQTAPVDALMFSGRLGVWCGTVAAPGQGVSSGRMVLDPSQAVGGVGGRKIGESCVSSLWGSGLQW